MPTSAPARAFPRITGTASPVRDEHVVRHGERRPQVAQARRVDSEVVAEQADAPRFVVRDPVSDAIAERAGDDVRVAHERLGRGAHGPPAFVLERHRQVPAGQRHKWGDARLEEAVHQAVVEREPGLVPRPRPAGSTRGQATEKRYPPTPFAQQRDVVAPAVVVVARDRTRRRVEHGAGSGAEPVPYRLTAAVLSNGALDLVRGGRDAPREFGRKPARDPGGVERLGGRAHEWDRRARGAGAVRPARQAIIVHFRRPPGASAAFAAI